MHIPLLASVSLTACNGKVGLHLNSQTITLSNFLVVT